MAFNCIGLSIKPGEHARYYYWHDNDSGAQYAQAIENQNEGDGTKQLTVTGYGAIRFPGPDNKVAYYIDVKNETNREVHFYITGGGLT